ncbi:serine hydrolase domain-containing protein [Nocardioides panaciterrulae]|uniref:D-alanyl-D-alanine carboxypeptidase n=1 Tax=Nocardioides panaciterrulae TaxID=661492 RepID=A0A7Y9E653_9ACTN|nr:serine hydrolase domain-containing protein [Nocardioides panaciterrulae]NYD41943.1 D-alanyl-D-alanine carboxypeptidase [Nocardioides panaciterrulae]
MTPEPVAPVTARRLLARLARAQATGRLPSVVAGVLRDGGLVWTGVYGAAPVPGHDPLDVQYRIGSITKTLTAVVVLRLARDGVLDLDTPASAWLGDVAYADRSLRSLLAHNSGMPSEPIGSWWERSSGMSWEELTETHDGAGEVFPHLQQFHYSNLGFALLGEVVARACDGSWWEAVRARVLEPLGMTRTTYLPQGAAAPGHSVHPYARTLVDEPATDTGAMAPAGQAWSTLHDLATYNTFLLRGHPDVLSLEDLHAASHPQSGDRDDALGYAHGLGFQLQAGGSGMLVGHTGSMPGFLAGCFVDRPRRTGAVVLTNATTGLTPGDLVAGLLEELELSEPTVLAPWRPTRAVPAELADVLGVWHWGNTPFVFALDGDELVASRDGAVKYRFGVVDGRVIGTFGYHAGEELRVVRRPDGSVGHLDVATFVYTRTPYDPEAPIPGGPPGRADR